MRKILLSLAMICLLMMVSHLLLADTVTIGSGVDNSITPLNTGANTSLFQGLYFPEELNLAVGSVITGIQLYTNTSMWASPYSNHHTKIWLGTTTKSSYGPSSQWVPYASLTQVFDGNVDLLLNSTITFTFDTPFTYNGNNLVLEVFRPGGQATSMMGGVPFNCQTIGSNRAINISEGMFVPTINPASPTGIDGMFINATGQFPKTTFIFSPPSVGDDLAAQTITGNSNPTVGVAADYSISVKNNGSNPQSSYQVVLYANDVEVASTNGDPIAGSATQTYQLAWTPAAAGAYILYAKVILGTDENNTNDQTPNLNANALPPNTTLFTVGAGGSTNTYPFDCSTDQSLFETVYLPVEIGPAGTLYGLQLFNNFQVAALNQTITIWMGESSSPDLTAGWIPSGSLNQVFYGAVDFPVGANTITIFFDTPYVYGGSNLVMMVNRPVGNATYGMTSELFVTQTRVTNSSRIRSGWGMDTIDPANPSGGSLTGVYPKTGFYKALPLVPPNSPTTIDMDSSAGTLNVTITTPIGAPAITVAVIPIADLTAPLPNVVAGSYAMVLTSGTATNVTLSVPAGTWYAVAYYGGSWHQGTPFPAVGPTDITFAGMPFAKADIPVVLGPGDPTLPVELSSFTAVLNAENYTSLTWISESETGLMGYKAYRSETADLNSAVIVSNLIAATNTSTTQIYNFIDAEVEMGVTYYYWLESIDYSSSDFHGPVSVTIGGGNDDDTPPVLPEISMLNNAYPNPFSPSGSTSITTFLKNGETGVVQIYNVRGQTVKTFNVGAGFQTIHWNGKDMQGNAVSSGFYLYKLITPSTTQTKKMAIIE